MKPVAPRQIRSGVLIAALALIALVACWIITPNASFMRVIIAIIATAPLWIFLPALKQGRRRAYAAMTLCAVPYLVGALTELIANPEARVWASATLVLAFGLFVLLIAFLRLTRGSTQPS